jgi:hypothetical protein
MNRRTLLIAPLLALAVPQAHATKEQSRVIYRGVVFASKEGGSAVLVEAGATYQGVAVYENLRCSARLPGDKRRMFGYAASTEEEARSCLRIIYKNWRLQQIVRAKRPAPPMPQPDHGPTLPPDPWVPI